MKFYTKIFACLLFFINGYLFSQIENQYPQYIENPVKYEPYYDIQSGKYYLYPKIGGIIVGEPLIMTTQEYSDFILDQKFIDYYKEKGGKTLIGNNDQQAAESKGLIPSIKVKSKIFEMIFGGNEITLKPQGYASFDLGIMYQKIDNPLLLPQNRKNMAIDLNQRIQLSLQGNVGKNLNLSVNYDTQAGFSFDNRMNIAWKPQDWIERGEQIAKDKLDVLRPDPEDRIVKKIEFGNINMPLSTSLISGSEALFGLKGEFQFGNTLLTAVFSEQQSETRNIVVQGNGAINTFKVSAVDYLDNQHYFLAQYFRDHYDDALKSYPTIKSKISISKIEVWKIDIGNTDLTGQKEIAAIRDLGESSGSLPDNSINGLYSQISGLPGIRDASQVKQILSNTPLPDYTGASINYVSGENFSLHRKVRKLSSSEYTFHPQLGYISLKQRLSNDQLLAVAFQYTESGVVKKVGEFSDENSELLIVKLLKPNTSVNTSSPLWNLMMKNIYSLEGSGISSENFSLQINYKDPNKGKINYLPDPAVQNKPLVQILNWDRLDTNGDLAMNASGDGLFDFVPEITINPSEGFVIFTKVEPFGSYLSSLGVNSQYVFNELYTEQKSSSNLTANKLAGRYTLEGRFQGEVGEGISLGAIGVPQGSVKVTANGQTLSEGVDYVVDYLLGRVTILNQAIKDSGVPINISLENQSAFNMQKKRFMGLNVEHRFSDELSTGLTFINYREKSLTHKVQYGTEPVNNSMLGMNVLLNKQSNFLTKVANWFPGVRTDAPSSINFTAEAAILIPGQNSSTGSISYIDDFENSSSNISLKDPDNWAIASMPEKYDPVRDPQFMYGSYMNDWKSNYGRGLMSWYIIDPVFFGIGGASPEGVDKNAASKHLQRRVKYKELYTNADLVTGDQIYMNTFDISFYPTERGPYNFNAATENPEDRWGGIARSLNVTNFTQANIEYLEFWMMDPYADNKGASLGNDPELLIQLGNISEDVLKDGFLAYENGLPIAEKSSDITNSVWGRQPKTTPIIYSFDSDNNKRQQDIGLDGLNDQEEAAVFNFSWVNPINGKSDPAGDNFLYYRGDVWDASAYKSSIIDRYRYYRNLENNSQVSSQMSTGLPSTEDINGDYNLDEDEVFNQYRIKLNPADLNNLGSNFVVDKKTVKVDLENGRQDEVNWYLLRVPVEQFESLSGSGKEILNNVRFIRLLMKGFNQTSTLRFGTFDLVRSDWKRYMRNIATSSSIPSTDEGIITQNIDNMTISAVNLEENSNSQPNYVLPPGIDREILSSNTGYEQQQNEASLKLEVNNLTESEPRGIYKNTSLDMRRYKKLDMFVHAEDISNPTSTIYDEKAKLFIRLGSDLSDNYYEYEVSLKYTSRNATTVYEIWPDVNKVELILEDFIKAKNEKDQVLASYSSTDRFLSSVSSDKNKKIYVKGRPSLGNISSIMIGVRNLDKVSPKNLILWLDELRLMGIDNEGGWAATTNLNFTLADFIQVDANGNYSSIGFGAIESKPSERSQEEVYNYNINAGINADKMLPESWKVKLPISVNYGESFVDPKYNPFDDDVKLKNDPRKHELNKIVRTYQQNKGISINNFRKERGNNKKARIYDIENLSLSMTYADVYFRDYYTAHNITQNFRSTLDYNFSTKGKFYEPFKNMKAVQDTMKSAKYLNWLKQINFNPLPSRISFAINVDRFYNEYSLRDVESYMSGAGRNYDALFSHRFLFGWNYNLGFNLTRSLKLDFSSNTTTILDHLNPSDQMIWKGLLQSGRPSNYNHKLQVNYKVPIHYLPYMDFTSLETSYTVQYDWTASSTSYINDATGVGLGNTAQNSQIINLVGNVDFDKFYSYFNAYQSFDNRKVKRQREIDSLNGVYSLNKEKGKSKKPFSNYKFKNKYKTTDYLWMLASIIKRGQIQFNQNRGAIMPGFLIEPNFFGFNSITNNGKKSYGPTFGFLFGSAFNIKNKAITSGWISKDELMMEPYTETKINQLQANIQLEPINKLLIDLNFSRNHQMTSYQEGFNINTDAYINDTRLFSSSIISIGTAFKNSDEVYNNLINNAKIISQRVAEKNGAPLIKDPDGFIQGYGLINSDVLLPAFTSSFTGNSASSQKLGYKRGFPIPNWAISYGGLMNIPFINYNFNEVRVNHAYVSSYVVNGVQTNLNYYQNPYGYDINGNRYTYYTYGSAVMVEGFSPLLGINFTMRNNMQFALAYNKDRIHTLSLTNYTLQEDKGEEWVVGAGYIIKDVRLRFKTKNSEKNVVSNINLRGDLSIRDNKTTIRRLINNETQISAGQRILSVRFSADYNFSQAFNLKFYYEQQMTKYKISTAYPLSTIRAGLSATFTFGN